MEINAGMFKPQSRGHQQSGRDIPAVWSQSVNASVPFCVASHTNLPIHRFQTFTFVCLLEFYLWKEDQCWQGSARYQLKPAAVTFMDQNTNLTPTVQFFYFLWLVYCRAVFNKRQFVLCALLLPLAREVAVVSLFLYLLEKNSTRRQTTTKPPDKKRKQKKKKKQVLCFRFVALHDWKPVPWCRLQRASVRLTAADASGAGTHSPFVDQLREGEALLLIFQTLRKLTLCELSAPLWALARVSGCGRTDLSSALERQPAGFCSRCVSTRPT